MKGENSNSLGGCIVGGKGELARKGTRAELWMHPSVRERVRVKGGETEPAHGSRHKCP